MAKATVGNATGIRRRGEVEDIEQMRDELERAERELREAHQKRDEFLAVLSHELRNPLTPIRNSLAILERAEPGGPQSRKARRIIDRQVTHLVRLIDDLLDVTRIARGKIQLQTERIEIGEVVRRAIENHGESFEASGILLRGDISPEPVWVEADGARVIQIVSNLLGNAEKFTKEGGVVLVGLGVEERDAVLRVRDTGVGIAKEMLPHLFEPFTQAPQAMDRAHGGLGLGLSMVRGLVDLHGGTVDIESDGPGRGTTVTVRLPLSAAPASTMPPPGGPRVPARRVLLVEDNEDAAETLKDALELGGHVVHVAHDGPSALALAHGVRPELAICDIGLPGMDGYELARAFRASPELRGIHLVALSGYAGPEDRRRAAEATFDRHLAKPLDLEALERLLAELSA